jgi:uncharacterized protein YkwD
VIGGLGSRLAPSAVGRMDMRSPGSRLICKSIAALAVGGAGLAAVPAASAVCPGADAQPGDVSVTGYEASLLCVVNEQRHQFGRRDLTPQRNLRRAAARHASAMVAGGYFAHTSPDGVTFVDRLVRAKFIPSSGRWRAGENLAAGRGTQGTPAAIATAWMNSKGHRRNLLEPGYTMVGIGVARGWPAPGIGQSNSVTIDMDLGWRR